MDGFAVTSRQMKRAEEIADSKGISYGDMMQNAGNACADEILKRLGRDMLAVVLCGSGNNGGDGFVIAGRLAAAGIDTTVILTLGKPKTDCAAYRFDQLRSVKILDITDEPDECETLTADADAVIDCVFGTGFHGALPDAVSGIFSAVSAPIRVAVDVPSGVDCDTGFIAKNAFKPTLTLVLAAMKKGFFNHPCFEFLGETKLLEIGIKPECFADGFEARLITAPLAGSFAERPQNSNKGTFGRLLNVCGSQSFPGACSFAALAAVKSGAGLCEIYSTADIMPAVVPLVPEAVWCISDDDEDFEKLGSAIEQATAVCIGCGIGNNVQSKKMTEFVVKNSTCPVILDADGINCISDNIDILRERAGELVITPHPKEFSRITGKTVSEIQASRIDSAAEFADEYGVIVVLKGVNTVIAIPGGTVFVNTSGNSALAKAGSGDVLSGIIGGMLAQGVLPSTAAASAVFFHGKAAELLTEKIPHLSVLPSDLIAVLPEVYSKFVRT